MHGTCDDHLPEYLDEFMWREGFGRTAKEAYEIAWFAISQKDTLYHDASDFDLGSIDFMYFVQYNVDLC